MLCVHGIAKAARDSCLCRFDWKPASFFLVIVSIGKQVSKKQVVIGVFVFERRKNRNSSESEKKILSKLHYANKSKTKAGEKQ
jgi:hypothetical protein